MEDLRRIDDGMVVWRRDADSLFGAKIRLDWCGTCRPPPRPGRQALRVYGLDTAVLVQTSHPTRTDGLDAAALAKLGLVQVATRTLKLTARALCRSPRARSSSPPGPR